MREKGPFDAAEPNEPAPPAKEIAETHPLFGRIKGTVTIPEGVDLTEPACPEWADLIDEMMSLPRPDRDTNS